MTIGVDLETTRRLVEAAEAFLRPQGEGLAAETRAPVPRETAEAFRALLERPEGARSDPSAETLRASEGASESVRVSGVEGKIEPGAPDRVEAPQPLEQAADLSSVRPEPLSPVELYRLQFSVNMHVFETKAMKSVRDAAASRLDEIVRSSG